MHLTNIDVRGLEGLALEDYPSKRQYLAHPTQPGEAGKPVREHFKRRMGISQAYGSGRVLFSISLSVRREVG
jgi:hypothetical protein